MIIQVGGLVIEKKYDGKLNDYGIIIKVNNSTAIIKWFLYRKNWKEYIINCKQMQHYICWHYIPPGNRKKQIETS